MDESTQKNTPDEHTQIIRATNQAGASESEFTQASPPREPQKYEYAIPEAEYTVARPPVEVPVQQQQYPPAQQMPQPQPYAPPARPARKGLSWLWIVLVGMLFGGTIVIGLVLFIVLRVVVTSRGTATPTSAPVAIAATQTPAGPTPTVGLGIQPWDG